MTIKQQIPAFAMLLILFRGIICTSNDVCYSYKFLESEANRRTSRLRENAVHEVSNQFRLYLSDRKAYLLKFFEDFCGKLNNVIQTIRERNPCELSNMQINEICNGSEISTYLCQGIARLTHWLPGNTCEVETRILQERCFKESRTTENGSIALDKGPQEVARRMNAASIGCIEGFSTQNVESGCGRQNNEWTLYFWLLEFLNRFHPGVRLGPDNVYY